MYVIIYLDKTQDKKGEIKMKKNLKLENLFEMYKGYEIAVTKGDSDSFDVFEHDGNTMFHSGYYVSLDKNESLNELLSNLDVDLLERLLNGNHSSEITLAFLEDKNEYHALNVSGLY